MEYLFNVESLFLYSLILTANIVAVFSSAEIYSSYMYAFVQNFKTLASLCSWVGRFEFYLVANSEGKFSWRGSYNTSHILCDIRNLWKPFSYAYNLAKRLMYLILSYRKITNIREKQIFT